MSRNSLLGSEQDMVGLTSMARTVVVPDAARATAQKNPTTVEDNPTTFGRLARDLAALLPLSLRSSITAGTLLQ